MNEAERYLEERNKPKAVAPSMSAPRHEAGRPNGRAHHPDAADAETPGWFSLEGRIGRQTYFWRMAAISLGSLVVVWLIGTWYGVTLANSLPEGVDLVSMAETAGAQIFLLVGFLAQAFVIPQETKRLHDLNISGWYQLVFAIPVIGQLFHLYVLFCPGTIGANDFG